MRSHPARRARTAPTIRVPAFERVGGGMKRLHRLKRIEHDLIPAQDQQALWVPDAIAGGRARQHAG